MSGQQSGYGQENQKVNGVQGVGKKNNFFRDYALKLRAKAQEKLEAYNYKRAGETNSCSHIASIFTHPGVHSSMQQSLA